MLLAKIGLRYRKVGEMPNVKVPLNGCSILIYMDVEGIPAIRVTGVYFTPAANARVEHVKMLKDKRSVMEIAGQRLGHIIGGGLNPPSWAPGYEKWISEAGLWTLTDPKLRTFDSGNALDRFLYLPGDSARYISPRNSN